MGDLKSQGWKGFQEERNVAFYIFAKTSFFVI